jgi:gliding motility-associated lipoprotein GldH
MKLRNSIFLFALALLSCNSNAVFEDYKSFENHSWNADSLVVFNFAITDTISRNQVVIKVRHTVNYEFQNLFLFVKAEQTDTVELMLADKSGEWLGKGIGDIREVEFIYQNEKIFHKQGKYTLELEQAMRYGALEKIQHLNNIEAIGFCVEKQNE